MDQDVSQQVDEGLRTSPLPDGSTVLRTWVLDTAEELAGFRAELEHAVAGDGADVPPELGAVAHSMVLVASELATNALRHGVPPTIVRLLRDDDAYILDVADHDLLSTPYIAGERPPGEGGFGLQIARRLAVAVGWYAAGTTKHVWAGFPDPRAVAPA